MYPTRKFVIRCLAIAAAVIVWLGSAQNSHAKTPDGEPPSVEGECDHLSGSLCGLCIAYCEAMDCMDPNQHASDNACDKIFANYMKKSGSEVPPCFMSRGGGGGGGTPE